MSAWMDNTVVPDCLLDLLALLALLGERVGKPPLVLLGGRMVQSVVPLCLVPLALLDSGVVLTPLARIDKMVALVCIPGLTA